VWDFVGSTLFFFLNHVAFKIYIRCSADLLFGQIVFQAGFSIPAETFI